MEYAPDPAASQLAALREALAPGGSVCVERRIRGGLGCTMDVLAVARPGHGSFRVILRRYDRWYSEHNPRAAQIEFEVLGQLRRHGVSAPEPLWVDRHGVFEEPAMVIEFIAGEPLRLPDDPHDYAAQLARMLAGLHDLPLAGLPDDLTDYNAREVAFLSAPSPPHTMASHRLGSLLWDSHRLELERVELGKGVFLHGDYWPGNTLWSQQDLISVVDFEEVGVGAPALDVATAVINLKFEPWPQAADRFVEVYRAETGRALDTLRFWKMKELRRPMPDIAAWLLSFTEIGPRPTMTADELRADHERLILEVLE